MKILAIRGCNLASLAGEFEIDLVRGSLGGAGVFAIVGNTGAGKSTLLDALCVALFDRTPRLTNHSRVVVGRSAEDPAALGAQDVRTLLRRGAAQGWAEVDFESGDARRYRARWSVRRARGNVDGALQAQQVTLTALDGGARLGGTKTETLHEIQTRLGLSFEQFRRSALLAQGEFAAFLRAEGKDRSELLERMTGTEIYSRLSIAAHLRASLAEHKLAAGRTAAIAIPVLDDDARRTLELELAFAQEAKQAARVRHAAAEEAARWVTEATRRTEAARVAEAALAVAEVGLAGADALRTELALRRRAEALRGAWDDVMRSERQVTLAARELGAARMAADGAAREAAALEGQRRALEVLTVPLRDARIAVGLVERPAPLPDVGRAERAGSAAQVDAVWLVARTALAAEVAGWAELDAKFAVHSTTRDAITSLERGLAEHATSMARLVKARDEAQAERREAAVKHAEAQRKADAYQKRRGLSLDAARRQEDQARVRLVEVERLGAIVKEAAAARAAVFACEQRGTELAAEAAIDRAARSAAETTLATTRVLRTERARALDELRRAAGYEHARTELVDGDPCPLCGALEHPWKDRGAFDELIASASARLGEVGEAIDAATATLATLEARAAARDAETARLTAQRTAATASIAQATAAWGEQLTVLGELSLVRDPTGAEAEQLARELRAVAVKKLEDARTTRSATEASLKAAAEAQADVQMCQANVDMLAAKLADLERRRADLASTVERLQGQRAERTERFAELTAQLEASVATWASLVSGETPPRKLEAQRAWLAEVAAAWRARADRVALAEAEVTAVLAMLAGELRAAEATRVEQAARHLELERRHAELATACEAARATFEGARAEAGFGADELRALLATDSARIDAIVDQLAALDRSVERSRAVAVERRALVEAHASVRPAAIDDAARVHELAALLAEAEASVSRRTAQLAADTDARARREEALAQLAHAEGEARIDRILGEVIGSHDGKRFRAFAQSLTLDGLLALANAHLDELAPRYQLERVPGHDLELQVIDRELGDEVRSVQSLSGGESFLASLALALGLSSMSAHDVRVRTLLIDEGFGTLDPATLDSALSVLDALQARGRQVGVISHVPQLVERVGACVRVVQRGGGRSEVIVA
ncbi:MAG: AAA family ATPase [Kofleriaceae bacterium]|nr:AAA family ATPase [Kofleriaceae bacterium]